MTINTLYELVRNSVERFASKVAFAMYDGEEVTYAEVGRRIGIVQDILTGAGLRPGDKVEMLFIESDATPRRDRFKVSGIYFSGMAELDDRLAVTTYATCAD